MSRYTFENRFQRLLGEVVDLAIDVAKDEETPEHLRDQRVYQLAEHFADRFKNEIAHTVREYVAD